MNGIASLGEEGSSSSKFTADPPRDRLPGEGATMELGEAIKLEVLPPLERIVEAKLGKELAVPLPCLS